MATTKATTLAHGQAGSIVSGTFADARISASSVSQHATSYDDNDVKNDIAIVALNQASDHSKVYYNLNEQVIDTFSDATGVNSATANIHNGSYSTLGLTFRYLRVYVTSGNYSSGGADPNAGVMVMNFNDGITDGTTAGTASTVGGGGLNNSNIPITATAAVWYTGDGSNDDYGTVDFGAEKKSITKLYLGKYRTHGDPLRYRLAYSSNDSDYYDVPIISSGMTYNTSKDGTSFDFSRHDDNEVNLSAFPSNGNKGYSSIEGGNNWVMGSTMTLISNEFTASSTPTKIDLLIMIENHADTATLNTDIKAYVARNTGTADWLQGTLVDAGGWGTNKKTLAFHDLDISSKTSGTAVRYKIELANQSTSKITKVHGVSIGWK
tara:strand:+ start:2165 stop:3301 length:1137 start_codon:yes stop_codon:yes gene_type:complete